MNGVPLNINWQQILLHMFNFVILFGALYFILYKPVKDIMDKRRQDIEDTDKDTKERNEKAKELETLYQGKLDKASEEITALKAAAVKEAQANADDKIANAKAQADKILSDAKAQGEREKARIIDSAGIEIARLASDAAEKAVNKSVNEGLDEFLASTRTVGDAPETIVGNEEGANE